MRIYKAFVKSGYMAGNEVHFKAESMEDARHWIINNLDCSAEWKFIEANTKRLSIKDKLTKGERIEHITGCRVFEFVEFYRPFDAVYMRLKNTKTGNFENYLASGLQFFKRA